MRMGMCFASKLIELIIDPRNISILWDAKEIIIHHSFSITAKYWLLKVSFLEDSLHIIPNSKVKDTRIHIV